MNDDSLRLVGDLLCAEQALRKKVAAALHDEIAQMLAAARMKVSLAKLDAGPKSQTDLDAVTRMLDDTMDAIRRLTRELAPPPPPDLAVLAALRWLAKDAERRHGAAVLSLLAPDDELLEKRALDARIAASFYAFLADLVGAVHRHGAIAEIAIETDGVVIIARLAVPAGSELSFEDAARERLRILGGALERAGDAIVLRAPLAR